MPRVLGVDIPNDKPTYVSLQYLHGIGRASALAMCRRLDLDAQRAARELTDDDVQRINNLLDNEYTVEGQLRRETTANIQRLKDVGSYRGLRHRRSLPVRGQNTQTNARTRKGAKKTVRSKKGVKDMRR